MGARRWFFQMRGEVHVNYLGRIITSHLPKVGNFQALSILFLTIVFKTGSDIFDAPSVDHVHGCPEESRSNQRSVQYLSSTSDIRSTVSSGKKAAHGPTTIFCGIPWNPHPMVGVLLTGLFQIRNIDRESSSAKGTRCQIQAEYWRCLIKHLGCSSHFVIT